MAWNQRFVGAFTGCGVVNPDGSEDTMVSPQGITVEQYNYCTLMTPAAVAEHREKMLV
jgi:hypothetical protein